MKSGTISILAIAALSLQQGALLAANTNDSKQEKAVEPSTKSEIQKVTRFKDSVRSALKNSSAYAMSKIDRTIAHYSHKNAEAVFGPNVEFSSSVTCSDVDQTNRDHGVSTNRGNSQVHLEGVVTQNIFHGFSTVNNLRAKNNAESAAVWKLDSATQDLIYSVAESMINLWYTHEDFKSAERKKENLLKELQAQKNSFLAGAATKYDVAKAEANYEQAVYEANLAKLNILSAEAEFTRITGEKPTDIIELPKFDCEMPKTHKELENISLNNNPNILEAKYAERSALYELNSARGKLAPKIDLIAKVGGQNQSYRNSQMFGSNTSERNNSISLQCSIPIYSNNEASGNTYCQISIANENAKKAAFNVKNIMNNIKKECSVSFNNYKIAVSMIKAAESAVKGAKIGADGDRQESALGLKSNTETLVRENQMYDSSKALAKSISQLRSAEVAMLKLMGKLDRKLLGL